MSDKLTEQQIALFKQKYGKILNYIKIVPEDYQKLMEIISKIIKKSSK